MSTALPPIYRAGVGEQVVLLHGLTGAWLHWHPVLADLVARYEVIAPTLSGHCGGPPYPDSAPRTIAGATDVLERQLDELGVGVAHIVGNSLGGGLALELAKRGRAHSVVAIAPAGGWSEGDGEPERIARFFARQIRLARSFAPYMPALMRWPSLRHLAMRDAMRHGELVSPADAIDNAYALTHCEIAEDAIGSLRNNGNDLLLRDLDRISCPVLLALPQYDRILPAKFHAPRFRAEIPGVESVTLPGCGHLPMWDDSRLIVQTISEFVDRR